MSQRTGAPFCHGAILLRCAKFFVWVFVSVAGYTNKMRKKMYGNPFTKLL